MIFDAAAEAIPAFASAANKVIGAGASLSNITNTIGLGHDSNLEDAIPKRAAKMGLNMILGGMGF